MIKHLPFKVAFFMRWMLYIIITPFFMIRREEMNCYHWKSYKIITLLLYITFTHIISIKSNQQSQFLSIRKWKKHIWEENYYSYYYWLLFSCKKLPHKSFMIIKKFKTQKCHLSCSISSNNRILLRTKPSLDKSITKKSPHT